jgi:tryptophan synthase alpha subunit
MVARIRAASDLPIALGFGISKPEHVRAVGQWADAAVVGSALVTVIAEAGAAARQSPAEGGPEDRRPGEGAATDLNTRVEEYVRWLKS